ncbi:MAG: alpha/beta hydrolase [Candidatus Bathyarchaeia archaeon]
MTYVKGSALFRCLMRLPEDYAPERSYPLVVGLHGGGSNPAHLITLWEHFPDRSFIYAVPQAPYPMLADAELAFDWALWPTGDEELISKATELSEKYIVNVVQDLTRRHNIDEVYLMGFSQGAILTYLAGIKHHHLFRGLICLSGPGLLAPLINPFTGPFNPAWLAEEFIQDAGELRVFIAHGKDDQEAEYEFGVRSRDVLVNHGYDVTFRDFEGGHRLPPQEILAQVVNWIKNPHQAT